jgi:hypothetical protein
LSPVGLFVAILLNPPKESLRAVVAQRQVFRPSLSKRDGTLLEALKRR